MSHSSVIRGEPECVSVTDDSVSGDESHVTDESVMMSLMRVMSQ